MAEREAAHLAASLARQADAVAAAAQVTPTMSAAREKEVSSTANTAGWVTRRSNTLAAALHSLSKSPT